MRKAVSVLASIPVALLTAYFALLAALTLLSQVLAGFVDLSQTSWTSFLNPAVLFGFESPGGTGGPLDALFGGPGAPGGTMNRYFAFGIYAVLTYASFAGLKALWSWGKRTETAPGTSP